MCLNFQKLLLEAFLEKHSVFKQTILILVKYADMKVKRIKFILLVPQLSICNLRSLFGVEQAYFSLFETKYLRVDQVKFVEDSF